MPYCKSCSEKCFKKNVKQFIREGRPVKQAVAMAYSVMRKSCKIRGRKRLTPKQMASR